MVALERRLSVLLVCTLFMISAFVNVTVPAEDEQSRNTVPKVVLCELFTKSTCGACQSADGAMDRLADNTDLFQTRIAILEWHVGPGGTGGDAYTTPAHDVRKSYYGGIPSIPRAVFDGLLWHAGGTIGGANDTYNDVQYKNRIDARPATTQVQIEVKKSLNPAGDAGTYNITVSALDTVLNTSLHLRVVLAEDGNETVGNAKFRYTPKEFLADVPITLQNAGDKVYLNDTFVNDYDKWKIALIVFVQTDTTKEVLQANMSLFRGNKRPELIPESLDFHMDEDTEDDHLDLDDVFLEPEGEHMTFQIESLSEVAHINIHKSSENVLTFTPEKDWSGEQTFKVTADDTYSKNDKTRKTFTVTVDPVNDAPYIKTPLVDFSMQEGATDTHIHLDRFFGDVEGDTLTYSVTGDEYLEVLVDPDAGDVVIEAPHGTHTINETLVFHAYDGMLDTTDDIKVTVKHINHAPEVLDSIDDLSMDEDTIDESIDLDDVFYDFDVDTLFFEAEGALFTEVTVDPISHVMRLEPEANWHGVEYIKVSASDNIAEPIFSNFTLSVNSVNDIPEVVRPLDDIRFDEDTIYMSEASLYDVFHDADLDPLTFEISELTNIASEVDDDGMVLLTPVQNWYGEELVTITANDGQVTTEYKVTVTVLSVNDPVLIKGVIPDTDRVTMDEGETITLTVEAADIDGDGIDYSWYINGARQESRSKSLVYETDHLSAGSYEVLVMVSDGPTVAENTWDLKVQDINRRPEVKLVSPAIDGKYRTSEPIEFKAEVSDQDETDILTIKWFIDGKEVPDSNKDALLDSLMAGNHKVKVTVTDGKDLSSDEVTIKVRSEAKDTPGFGLLVLLGAVLSIMLFRRRR